MKVIKCACEVSMHVESFKKMLPCPLRGSVEMDFKCGVKICSSYKAIFSYSQPHIANSSGSLLVGKNGLFTATRISSHIAGPYSSTPNMP